jgi:hypothetical protein
MFFLVFAGLVVVYLLILSVLDVRRKGTTLGAVARIGLLCVGIGVVIVLSIPHHGQAVS